MLASLLSGVGESKRGSKSWRGMKLIQSLCTDCMERKKKQEREAKFRYSSFQVLSILQEEQKRHYYCSWLDYSKFLYWWVDDGIHRRIEKRCGSAFCQPCERLSKNPKCACPCLLHCDVIQTFGQNKQDKIIERGLKGHKITFQLKIVRNSRLPDIFLETNADVFC